MFEATSLQIASLLDTAGIIALGVILFVLCRKLYINKSGPTHS